MDLRTRWAKLITGASDWPAQGLPTESVPDRLLPSKCNLWSNAMLQARKPPFPPPGGIVKSTNQDGLAIANLRPARTGTLDQAADGFAFEGNDGVQHLCLFA